MGRRGPAPTPKKILASRGSWRADLGGPEPQPQPGIPPAPSCLGEAAREEWEYITKLIDGMGLAATIDRALLTTWCEAWGDYVEALKIAREEKMPKSFKSGSLRNKMALADQLLKLAGQFGCSPAARARLKAPDKPAADAGKGRFFQAG